MQLKDHTFLITGGASGLGEACARRFIQHGARVLIVDLAADAAESLAASLGDRARLAVADVTNPQHVQAAIDLAQGFGGLQGVVQCAGILGAARIVGREGPHELSIFERVIRVNLIGTFNVLRLAAAAMANNTPGEDGERGVIINTSSVAAFEGQIGQAAYSASKGGVASLVLPAARELARFGIRICAIAPGVFLTPMMEATTPELQQSLASQIPFPPRLGEPDEFAALAQHIFENRMLNGCVLRLDGAMRMGAK
jgi:NAD(P)-dependent dehydrogenase (short-subunit alcohol dehydrogenase family)